MRRKKYLIIIIYLLGLGLILYPLVSRAYYDYFFRLEVERIKSQIHSADTEQAEVLYKEQLAYNQNSIVHLDEIEIADVDYIQEDTGVIQDDTDVIEDDTGVIQDDTGVIQNDADIIQDSKTGGRSINLKEEGVLGVISISKIDLACAIRDGATDKNLLNGVARVEGTSYPVGGMDTNCVIAGHSGNSGRALFSRITQLEDGDMIEIQNQKETLHYKVFGNHMIELTNVAALAPVPGQDMITLLTCARAGTRRYLVFAKRTDPLQINESEPIQINDQQGEIIEINDVQDDDPRIIDFQDENKQIDNQQGESIGINDFQNLDLRVNDQQDENMEINDIQVEDMQNDLTVVEVIPYIQMFLKRYGLILLVLLMGIVGMYYLFFSSKNDHSCKCLKKKRIK